MGRDSSVAVKAGTSSTVVPDFRSPEFLLSHASDIFRFFHPRVLDAEGHGLVQCMKEDGTVEDRSTRHLVSSARYVVDYALAVQHSLGGDDDQGVRAGLKRAVLALREHHYRPETGGYAWMVKVDEHGAVTVDDDDNYCYGFGFICLAYACAIAAGQPVAKPWLEELFNVMEEKMYEPEPGAYAYQATKDWEKDPYRGQNPNMHMCEAMIAAYGATGETRYLDRALKLAHTVTVYLSEESPRKGLLWEHYDTQWQEPDLEFNKDVKDDLFRPWGFQPGHHLEWTKLLLTLERVCKDDAKRGAPEWVLPRAKELFEWAVSEGWDKEFGGLYYSTAIDGGLYDTDKYYWVHSEGFAAAALLALRTGEEKYWEWYDKIWAYAWEHLVDHDKTKTWVRLLNRENQKPTDEPPVTPGKTDYHPIAACVEVALALERARAS